MSVFEAIRTEFRWIPTIGGALLGAIGSHLWRRFRERMITLRWSANNVPLAIGGELPELGRITVQHEGQDVDNVMFSTVEVENESVHDIENLEVVLGYRDGTTFLTGGGSVAGSMRRFDASEHFRRLWEENPSNPAVLSFREYVIPVLNRGATAVFTHVVRCPDVLRHRVELSCVHPGVRVVERARAPQMLGVTPADAARVGMPTVVLLVATLVYSVPIPWVDALVALLLGLFAQVVGIAMIHVWRVLVRVLS